MRPRALSATTLITTSLAAGALVLAGCGSGGSTGAAGSAGSGGTSGSGASGSAAPAAPGGTATGAAVLRTWTSPLGPVVVTADGRAVYVFDRDHPGAATSACTGTCAHLWPAVTATSGTPQVNGVTGTVGTAPGEGGAQQLTLDGRRLYTYAGDAAGQVSGEGVQGSWWVVAPSGAAVQRSAAPSSSAPSSSDGGYSY